LGRHTLGLDEDLHGGGASLMHRPQAAAQLAARHETVLEERRE